MEGSTLYAVTIFKITDAGWYEFLDAEVDLTWLAACAFIEDHAADEDLLSVTVMQERVHASVSD